DEILVVSMQEKNNGVCWLPCSNKQYLVLECWIIRKARSQFRGDVFYRGEGYQEANKWYYVPFLSVIIQLQTTTDFIADQGNAISVDSNSSYIRSKDNDGTDFLLKPALNQC
ncbi:hypothetical protein SDJN02_01156, partial [Cucurbita argyrosperma subsp. argyrosperma]